jgi:hypothetical protein
MGSDTLNRNPNPNPQDASSEAATAGLRALTISLEKVKAMKWLVLSRYD